jgi:two-component system, cell cycle sensor histidine kinase and response regulator CckA
VVKYRTWIRFPRTGRRYMDIVYTPCGLSDNQVTGCVVISRDVTDRFELERKLENAQKMELMGTLAGGVAHDLNNILSGIVSYPELLLMQLPEDSSLIKPIRTIKKSGEKAAVIVQDLLTLARRGVACKEPVDLNDIIVQFLNSPECKKVISFHEKVTIETVLANPLNQISGSSVHLWKTVMNLVSNAAEAMPEGGRITIKTANIQKGEVLLNDIDEENNGEFILLEVADTGSGISRADMDKIFEPFYTKKVMGRSGTGLGLAVVWGTIMDHHGHINVQSDGKNGSRFQLYFPVCQSELPTAARIEERIDYKGNGERILIVDDLEEQREIASNILTTLGYTVSAVSSGEDAILYLRKKPVDLVILDMLMTPGIGGLETYEEILKIRPGQKAIIASGFAETDRVKNALDIGVGQFIKKPYNVKDVGRSIKRELEK